MNWELSAKPYLPIHRRRTIRRRIAIGGLVLAVALPIVYFHERWVRESVGAQVFDDVASSVAAAYYDPGYHGRSWRDIAAKYRPLVVGAQDVPDRYRALQRMLSTLGDSHTAAFSPDDVDRIEHRPGTGVTGALLGSIEGRDVVMAVAKRSPAARAGIQRGDIVVRCKPRGGPPGTRSRCDVVDPINGRSHAVTLRLAPEMAIDDPAGPQIDWDVVAPGVGYLRIASFPEAIGDVLGWAMQELGAQRAMIVDLRSNPGGMLDAVDSTAGVFLPKGTLVVSGWRRVRWFGPQRFRANDSVGAHYAGRVFVLIDGTSESGAETLAAALRSYHRATLIGTRTAGKVMGVDLEEPLPDGGLLRVATLDMITPNGVRLEGRGVQPDVVVARTPADVARGRDPQLRAAIALAQKK